MITVEDDLELAVDFFHYFLASARVLEVDESVFCVSAWNDHGQRHHVLDPAIVRRTDFFPGLGWMTHKVCVEDRAHAATAQSAVSNGG